MPVAHTAKEIAEMLAREAEAVAAMLLPQGQRQGHEWEVGSVHGEPGRSCKVRVAGGNAGIWKDFASGDGGDLLDLWAAARGLTLKEALDQARDHLGLERSQFEGHRPREYAKPEPPKAKALRQGNAVMEYLTGERGLSVSAVMTYKLAADGDAVVFPYIREGELVFWKARGIRKDDNGRRKTVASKGAEPILFGWQAIDPLAREVVICEGEIDAPTLYDYGWPALSVPNGANGLTWIESEFEHLARFDTIYLCFDMDADGRRSLEEISTRLGRHRCRIVELPRKDANECRQHGVSEMEIEDAFRAAVTLDPEELRPAGEFVDAVIREFYPATEEAVGLRAPWGKLVNRFRFRPGEITVLAGINGHGKSQAAGHMVLDAMHQGARCCVASMEMRPARWLMRLTRQSAGFGRPAAAYIRAIHDWYGDRLWVFDVVGTAKVGRIVDVFGYAHQRYGVRFYIIDNMAKCSIHEDDYRGQKEFIDKLGDFAKATLSHVILVTHSRKVADEKKHAIGKMDVKGTGAITDMADNTIIWWRNRGKEDRAHVLQARGEEVPQELLNERDAVCLIDKQRNGDWEGAINLWFDPESYQFLDHHTANPKRYVEFVGDPEWAGLASEGQGEIFYGGSA